jgi:glycosyltransferase involved in cell wall biosynthesis
MYGKYLNPEKYEVHFFCFDQGLPKISLNNVIIHYQILNSRKALSFLKYFWNLKLLLNQKKFDLIFHVDSKFTLIIRMLNPFQPMILDIRSGDLSLNKYRLRLKNSQIYIATKFYKGASVISESLRDFLGMSEIKTVIIPLGGEKQLTALKFFDKFHLLYIGSIDNRNIHETVQGLSIYLNKEGSIKDVTYDIIGFGKNDALTLLDKAIEDTGLRGVVHYHGRKTRDELFPFFEKCNVGIAYVPKTKAYDCQPVTKLFECVLAGMPVIATDTLENKHSLMNGCGEFCSDNPTSFAIALERLIKSSPGFDSEKIKSNYYRSEWKNIVKNILEPYFDDIIKS